MQILLLVIIKQHSGAASGLQKLANWGFSGQESFRRASSSSLIQLVRRGCFEELPWFVPMPGLAAALHSR